MLRARAASTAFSRTARSFSDATLNPDNLSEYFRAASEFPDLPETPPPPVRIFRRRTVATQTEVTVAPNNNNNENNKDYNKGGDGRNMIVTNAAAFSERRDLERWAQMGSLTF